MPGADWSIFASARAGHGICMSRFATLGAQLRNFRVSSLFTPCWPWVWLYKSTPTSHTHPPHPKCVTKHTSHPPLHGPTPHMALMGHLVPFYPPWLVRRGLVKNVFCSSSPTQDKVLVCVMARPAELSPIGTLSFLPPAHTCAALHAHAVSYRCGAARHGAAPGVHGRSSR